MATAAATSASATACSAWARSSPATSTSTDASSVRRSRANRSGSSLSRRSRAACSRASRARSRPACAGAAFPTGDHLFLESVRVGNPPRPFSSKKQPRPNQIGHLGPTDFPTAGIRSTHPAFQPSPPRTPCISGTSANYCGRSNSWRDPRGGGRALCCRGEGRRRELASPLLLRLRAAHGPTSETPLWRSYLIPHSCTIDP